MTRRAVEAILDADPDLTATSYPDVPAGIDRILRRALAKAPMIGMPRCRSWRRNCPPWRPTPAAVDVAPRRRRCQRVSTTERRRAAVLVTVVSDYPSLVDQMTPIEAHRLIARVRDAAVDVVREYGGLVNQAIGEEIVSLFGVPIAHDDDDLRAVRAALELHARVRALERADVRRTSGCASSRACTSARSSHDGCTKDRGATTSPVRPAALASRLAALADPDDVWVSPETQRLVGPYVHTAPCAPVVLDSQVGPVTPFRVLGETGIATRLEASSRTGLTPYVGRQSELSMLQSHVTRAGSGSERSSRWSARRAQERAGCCTSCRRVSRDGTERARAAGAVPGVRRRRSVRRLRADSVRGSRPPAAAGERGCRREDSRGRRSARAVPAALSASAVGDQRRLRAATTPPRRTSPGGPARRAGDVGRCPDAPWAARRADRGLALGGHRIACGVPPRRGTGRLDARWS